MWSQHKSIMNLPGFFRIAPTFVFLAYFAAAVYADVCVWRNPERTMRKIFPEAHDYKTITTLISDEKREVIEKRLGEELAPGERHDWIYYEITGDKGEQLGYIIADAEKGEYGVIEMVMGITPDGKVTGLYIQRARERDDVFKSEKFLNQFVGKSIENPIKIGDDIKAEKASTAVKAVILGVRKMLIFYDELGKQKLNHDTNKSTK